LEESSGEPRSFTADQERASDQERVSDGGTSKMKSVVIL